ncbi:UPF0606 protein KIAA1549L isoform X1 [Hemitrygon akajei]|uniref:UPF0606 protein KIAA1549L isoform X1 n=1 Tax=Hemitrygon akajei TaxID=2704970 RepID=UPI003BF966F7
MPPLAWAPLALGSLPPAMSPSCAGDCVPSAGSGLQVTAARCLWLCALLLLQPVSSWNGQDMIYQLLDLPSPLPQLAQQPFRSPHFSEVWSWATRPARHPTLPSYPLSSSSEAEEPSTDSFEEAVARISLLSPHADPTPDGETDLDTSSSVMGSPDLSSETEMYGAREVPEGPVPTPAEEEAVLSDPEEISPAALPKSSDASETAPVALSPLSSTLWTMIENDAAPPLLHPLPQSPSTTALNGTTAVAGTVAAKVTSISPLVKVNAGKETGATSPSAARTSTASPRPVRVGTASSVGAGGHRQSHLEKGRTSAAPSLALTAALTSLTTAALAARDLQTTTPASVASRATAATSVSSLSSPSLNCRLSDQLWVRTVVTLTSRRIQVDATFKQNLTRGLNEALNRAFFSNGIRAEIESLDRRNKVFIGFYAVSGNEVYIPTTVTEVITAYGVENLSRDLQNYIPDIQSVLIAASPWAPLPAPWFQLRTVLQFVSTTDIIRFCSFTQTMEARLQRAFEEAASRAATFKSHLKVQILNTSVLESSTAVSMVYMVRNQSALLNGTTASGLLHHLTPAELGYYLAYPPLTLAEPVEYNNLDTSPATEKYWVVTVILGVDNSSLGERYQRFASLMEQRLANLFVSAQQQGRRFRRASTTGAYTVQLVRMNRLAGPRNPAELTYYALEDGRALLGTTAAKILNTVDPQSMALELGYRVHVQAEPVVKNPPNNLWIIAAVLAPVGVVTVIIIIISTVLCRKNKSELKSETMSNLHQRAKPVQGFDYAKQHIGQYGGEDEVTITQETVILPIPGRDALIPQEREAGPETDNSKATKSIDIRRSRLQSDQDSIISEQSANLDSTTNTAEKPGAQQKTTKEGLKRQNVPVSDEEENATLFEHVSKTSDDPFDTPSGSVQLLSIKPLTAHPGYPQSGSEKSPEMAAVNGEVSKALKQKSDIEHYRNKLRLKAKRKGYYDFPEVENGQPSLEQQRKVYEKGQMEVSRALETEIRASSTYSEARNRQSQVKNTVYRSRQSLNSPSPGGTEMDLLVTREKSRRGIRNNGYDTEPELIEETNVDRVTEPRNAARLRQAKGHSESSTLSSQPSIDEVRQHMHQLLEEAFSLASTGRVSHGRHQVHCAMGQPLPYTELVTSAPGTMSRSRAGLQWVPTHGQEVCQYSLPRPAYRYSQLPEMSVGSPPPVPPRNAPMPAPSLRRSTSESSNNTRVAEGHGSERSQHEAPYVPISKSAAPADQATSHYSGSSVPAVYAIPANRSGYPNYYIPAPASYRNHGWAPYIGDGEGPGPWAENVTLPGYVEAFPHARYPHCSPPRQYSQTQPAHLPRHGPSTAVSQQSLADTEPPEAPYNNISTTALVKAIREEVAKLAKKQTCMFEFQV